MWDWYRLKWETINLARRIHRRVRRAAGLPPVSWMTTLPSDGLRLHVGAGQTILEGYINIDGYDNEQRPEHFQTPVKTFVRAELLDTAFEPESVVEIRSHHMFEHVSILDVDRMLRGWNRILKPGGLVWIETPDFEGCARAILRLRKERDKEFFYRHIFGSQFGPGELHKNGLTPSRFTMLLEDYGFEIKEISVRWVRRPPRKPDGIYPANFPLPDVTVKAIKVGPPKRQVIEAEYTPVAYRKMYPNPELQSQ